MMNGILWLFKKSNISIYRKFTLLSVKLGLALTLVVFAGCGGSSGDGGIVGSGQFTLGGTVSGLVGTVVLQANGADDLRITANGTFTFSTAINDGAAYIVTVKTQPSGQTCTASSNTGTIAGANVTDVSVVCAVNTYTVGGTVSGLTGTVVLQDNGADDLSISADGAFTFATKVADGAAYLVTVKTQPTNPNQTCTASSNTGTIAGANVTNVSVVCATNTYTVGGTVSGLTGTVVLRDNGADDLSISTNGSFTFTAPVADGGGYTVTVKTQPTNPNQTCTASNNTGTIAGANVTDVSIVCATNTYTVGGIVSGLTGTVVLQNNSSGDLSITSNGSFTFATPLADGGGYLVTVKTQPTNPNQTCTASSNIGTLAGANVTNVSVVCATNTYTVGGTVSGLTGTVVLQDNGADDLIITADGSFTFAAPVADGAGYNVTVKTQPTGQTCTASSNTGTIAGADVTDVSVVCAVSTYTVGGTVSGLTGTVVLQDNGADDLSISSNGTFTFATEVAYGAGYNVTVKTQPTGQICTASSNTGTIAEANVTDVSVVCASWTGTKQLGASGERHLPTALPWIHRAMCTWLATQTAGWTATPSRALKTFSSPRTI